MGLIVRTVSYISKRINNIKNPAIVIKKTQVARHYLPVFNEITKMAYRNAEVVE